MKINKQIYLLYSIFPNREEAISVARILLEKQLIACANVYDNVVSVYRWEGKVQEGQEVALMAKTAGDRLPAAIEVVKNLHSYQLPCIIAYPITEGFPPFLQWVVDETDAAKSHTER